MRLNMQKLAKVSSVLIIVYLAGFGLNEALAASRKIPSIIIGKQTKLNLYIMGVNDNIKQTLNHPFYADSYMLAKPTLIRYPGGSWASCWDWRNQTVFPKKHLVKWFKKIPRFLSFVMPVKRKLDLPLNKKKTSIENYVKIAKSLNAQICWVLNFSSDTLENATAFIQYIKDKGYPLKYVELGNEYCGGSFSRRFPTVESYLKEADKLAAAIKKIDPDIKLACPAGVWFSKTYLAEADTTESMEIKEAPNRHKHWVDVTLKRHDNIDIIKHMYTGFNSRNKVLMRKFDRLSLEERVRYFMLAPQFQYEVAELMYKKYGKKFWMTEYNMGVHKGSALKFKDTMINALYMASWQCLMLPNTCFELANWHSINGSFGFIRPSRKAKGYLTISPAVQLFSEMSSVSRWADSVNFIKIKNVPKAKGNMHYEGEKGILLHGLQFNKGKEHKIVLLNLSPKQQLLSLPDQIKKITASRSLSAAAVDKQIRVAITRKDAKFPLQKPLLPKQINLSEGKVNLPAYSFNLITWEE